MVLSLRSLAAIVMPMASNSSSFESKAVHNLPRMTSLFLFFLLRGAVEMVDISGEITHELDVDTADAGIDATVWDSSSDCIY